MRALRLALSSACFVVSLIAGAEARADAPPETCSTAYMRGHEERLAGRLFNARKAFLECAAAQCPASISNDCQRWTKEVEADLPTVRLLVRTRDGKPVKELQVFADGERIPESALRAPIILEAGPHELRFEAPGYETVRVDKALRPSDREVEIIVTMRPPLPPEIEPARAHDPAPKVPVLSIALAGIGVVSLAGSLYFGLTAQSEYNDLKRTCAPRCREADADAMYSKAIVSNVTLAVSVAAFTGAAVVYLVDRNPSTKRGNARSGVHGARELNERARLSNTEAVPGRLGRAELTAAGSPKGDNSSGGESRNSSTTATAGSRHRIATVGIGIEGHVGGAGLRFRATF